MSEWGSSGERAERDAEMKRLRARIAALEAERDALQTAMAEFASKLDAWLWRGDSDPVGDFDDETFKQEFYVHWLVGEMYSRAQDSEVSEQ